ncbi:MAG: cysteine--tRNA ligase [Bacteroidia bacterium]|nr:cysteine--tRNA ligase [Bacteroidia bacterium]
MEVQAMGELQLYNTMSRRKEVFKPINPPHVGLYVCGPTVYGDPHLGHARPLITFDVLVRLLRSQGYKVRYVRNITDVGHLEQDADEGEDKIQKKARLEQLEPMEVAHYYTVRYHQAAERLNVLPPSIEPQASGHIIEQIAYVEHILKAGFAYEVDGSVYFDIEKYNAKYGYGQLSGRRVEEMLSNTRELEGQREKRNPLDFALWKRATPEHIMRWPSPWGEGFPGWHLECSAMGEKYLGERFDIHGGGLDLMFPHHECEIAQEVAAHGAAAPKYWVHNNMVTVNGQKMGKSLGNFISLEDLFAGQHGSLSRPYSPMTIRFFILQAHYRSTLDFSDGALQAAEKGFERLVNAVHALRGIAVSDASSVEVESIERGCMEALFDDLNTPVALAHLFEGVKLVGQLQAGSATISRNDQARLIATFERVAGDILGLRLEHEGESLGGDDTAFDTAMRIVLEYRAAAKAARDYAKADAIRNALNEAGIEVQDRADGATWSRK